MKKLIAAVAVALLLTGCGSPSFKAEHVIPEAKQSNQFVVVKDDDTREGFLLAIQDWLEENGYKYETVADDTKHDHSKVTIEYEGSWSWDLALYLSDASIEAFHEGQRVGAVEFSALNTLGPSKFGDARERIFLMMDVLTGKTTATAATATQ